MSFTKTRLVFSCLLFSIMVHLFFFYAWKMFGNYNFVAPVKLSQEVMVDLSKMNDTASRETDAVGQQEDDGEEDAAVVNNSASTSEENDDTASSTPERRQQELKPVVPDKDTSTNSSISSNVRPPEVLRRPVTNSSIHPLKIASEFLATKNEKLTYLISMFGLPVGSAELEAKNENGEIRITMRTKSNIAISSVFPVDNVVETRHIDGQFIITNIRQQEGSFKNDEEFSINLRKKRVTCLNHITGRSLSVTVPNDEVLDTVSGIYYLRNRQLQVGKNEILHIFDSETYADVPVEILRREKMRLPNFKEIDTVVVRPLQMTAGIFRRTGDVQIWLTDDEFKVPVKIVTTIALGTVTAELVSAESEPFENGDKKPISHEPKK